MKHKDRENVKNDLNFIGKGFCLAKWLELDLDLSLGRNRSCNLVPYHSLPLDDLKDNVDLFNNSEYKKIQRKFMLDEIQPKECNLCWEVEKNTKKASPRIEKSFNFYSKERIDLIRKVGYTKNIDPAHLQIIFSRNDNILTMYDTPEISQTWKTDIQLNGPYVIDSKEYNTLDFSQYETVYHSQYKNPYVDLFWIWFSKSYSKLSKLTIYGGDPLMDKNIFRILEFLINNPNKNLTLEIISNCDPSGDRWKGFIDLIKKVSSNIKYINLYCKLDGWGSDAEYIHHGLSIKRLEKNLHLFLKSCKNRSLIFKINFNLLSYNSLLDLFKKIHSLRRKFFNNSRSIRFEIDIINWSNFFHPSNFKIFSDKLDLSIQFMKENLETRGNKYLGFTIEELDQIKNLKTIISTKHIDRCEISNFLEFIKQFDKRHNKSFERSFSEYLNSIK